MREFLALLGELFLITVLQSVVGFFIDAEKQPYMRDLVNIACYLGALYLILNFAYTYLFTQIMNIFNF